MPLIIASHDSLPYIESAPSASELQKIAALISAELPSTHATTPHPLLPPLTDPAFTPAFAQELARIAAGQPLTDGIDLSRYEPAAPPADAPASEHENALQAAYASGEHLKTRLTNLTLLNEFGRNAWLVHNSQLEVLLTALEEELMALKTECEVVNKARKGAQTDVEGELKTLEERWRRGVGRVLEVEVAAEKVRMGILERRRGGRV